MKRLSLLLLFAWIAAACQPDEAGVTPNFLQPPVITGYLFSENGMDLYGTLGSPNIHLKSGNFSILTYPNPAFNYVGVRVQTSGGASVSVPVQVWLVPAVWGGAAAENPVLSASVPALAAPLVSADLENGWAHLDVSHLPPGHYRIYVKAGDELFWNNLLKPLL